MNKQVLNKNLKKEKVVIAYSGGLDTSVMITWLIENYNFEVIACIVDVGQKDDFNMLKKRAISTGAKKVYVIDAKEEFVKNYIFNAIKANAIYEGKYLLGTALARPLIAKKVVDIAKKENARYLSHGATGKGNDQVRFELTFKYLYPEAKIIAPWRIWELKSREDEIDYAKKHKIPVPVTKEKPYSSDPNIWHISYEGGILENLENPPYEEMFTMTVSPKKAKDEEDVIEIEFEKGVPVKLYYNKKVFVDSVKIIDMLNNIGGKNGIGRVDIVENRLVGIKSRGVYESPAATILYFAHKELESLVLDRETLHYKEHLALDYAELVYYGLWFSPMRENLDNIINATQKYVSGKIKLGLYKGNINVLSRSSKYSLYKMSLASFNMADKGILEYNQKDAEGFINLFGLPYKVVSLRDKLK
ncbi:MAG: argininosuccinate synthase [Endomicrobiia bacterium]